MVWSIKGRAPLNYYPSQNAEENLDETQSEWTISVWKLC